MKSWWTDRNHDKTEAVWLVKFPRETKRVLKWQPRSLACEASHKNNFDAPDSFNLVKNPICVHCDCIHEADLVACIYDSCLWNVLRVHYVIQAAMWYHVFPLLDFNTGLNKKLSVTKH